MQTAIYLLNKNQKFKDPCGIKQQWMENYRKKDMHML